MSSTSFQPCEYCGWNKIITNCYKCGLKLCRECFGKHNEKICELLTKNVRTLVDTCTNHSGSKIVSFCYICLKLLCKNCTQYHANHTADIFGLTEAVEILSKTIPELKKIYEKRLSEIDRENKTLNKYGAGSKENNSFVREKLQVYEQNTYGKYTHMMKLKAVVENAIEILPQLRTCKTNPLIFIRLWIGIESEIKNLEEEVRNINDEAGKVSLTKSSEITPRRKEDVVPQEKHIAETTNGNAFNDPRKTQQSSRSSTQREIEQRTIPYSDKKGQLHDNVPAKPLKDSSDQPPKHTQQISSERKNDQHSSVNKGGHASNISDTGSQESTGITNPDKLSNETQQSMNRQDIKQSELQWRKHGALPQKPLRPKTINAYMVAQHIQTQHTSSGLTEKCLGTTSGSKSEGEYNVVPHKRNQAKHLNTQVDDHLQTPSGHTETGQSFTIGSNDERRKHNERTINNMATSGDVSGVTWQRFRNCSNCKEMDQRLKDLSDKLNQTETERQRLDQQHKELEKESAERKNEYVSKLKNLKIAYKKMKDDYIKEHQRCEELETQDNAKFNTMEKEGINQRNESENTIKQLQTKITDLELFELKQEQKIKMLEKRETESRDGMSKLSKINKERRAYVKDLERMNQQLTSENAKWAADIVEARETLGRYINEIEKKNCEMEIYVQHVQVYKDETDNAAARENEVSRQLKLANDELLQRSKRIRELDKAVKALKSERDDLQTRLSSFAGEKLTRGNPAITDLGDSKRPMKIGEMYGELYDNEWTDAMEITDTVKKRFLEKPTAEIEEIIIHHLRRILTICYQGCLQRASKQAKDVAAILGIKLSNASDKVNETELNKLQGIMTYRSKVAADFAKQLADEKAFCETMLDDWDYPFKNEDVMNELTSGDFYKRCLQICWYMVIQNPVMCLDDEIPPGTTMNKDIYREFTKSGDKVVYVVWPALFLHKDGPVLYKGVVQVK